jgi:acetylornithine/N-succinyldiaminopimelate aminotransferase
MRKEVFLKKLGQTSPFPFLIDVDYAKGIYIYDKSGKSYMDMISGVAVNNIGHRHPKVIEALKAQLDKHLHVMVYGEFIQDSENALAEKLTAILPESLNCVYVVNSGTEANEAALKLAKRVTGRTQLISFRGSYHGSTHGSMSVSGNEIKKLAFRPLLPDVHFLQFNKIADLERITERTAGVIVETIQGDAGVRVPDVEFLQALRKKCNETGSQLIFDEIQVGFGRTGRNFAFEHFGVVPDILTLGKALGGGMSIGALISSHEKMNLFTFDPMLGHITTFGGHPMNCAAAAAAVDVLVNEIDLHEIERLGALLETLIAQSPEIKAVRRKGMLFAFDMESSERVARVVDKCLEKGLITFWFLSHPYSFRLSPPLNISEEEIRKAGELILAAIKETE